MQKKKKRKEKNSHGEIFRITVKLSPSTSPHVSFIFTCKMSRILSRLSARLGGKETLVIGCSFSSVSLTEIMAGTEGRVVCIAVDGSEHSEKAFDCK